MKLLVLFLSVFLLASACTPITASEYLLQIFGNANMDDTIDEQDIDYLKGVIAGTNPVTNLSDANYNGAIDDQGLSRSRRLLAGRNGDYADRLGR